MNNSQDSLISNAFIAWRVKLMLPDVYFLSETKRIETLSVLCGLSISYLTWFNTFFFLFAGQLRKESKVSFFSLPFKLIQPQPQNYNFLSVTNYQNQY